jgi:hypothetical protein
MTIYPKAKDARTDPKWGGQKFGKAMGGEDGKTELETDYVPVPLDSEEDAAARALAALVSGKNRETAMAVGLAGADEVGTMNRILDEIESEVAACRAVSPADYSTVTAFKDALPVKYLDVTLWYDGLKVEANVSTFDELKMALTRAKEML